METWAGVNSFLDDIDGAFPAIGLQKLLQSAKVDLISFM
jgi:hypothetical protein